MCEKRGKETAGPSTTLRSGRDDNTVVPARASAGNYLIPATQLSSRPERTRISYFALRATTTGAALRRESRMQIIKATGLDRKSGGA